jgi:phosphoglycerate kinase
MLTVLLRCDLNVPIDQDFTILDDSRIVAIQDTVKFFLNKNARIVLLTHLGRPQPCHDINQWDPSLSTLLLKTAIEKILNQEILYIKGLIGTDVYKQIQKSNHHLILLENLRFHPGEETNNENFAKELSYLGDIYVNDAFSICHRSHASVSQLPLYMNHSAGCSLQKDITAFRHIFKNPKHPFVVCMGGAKLSTKLPIIEHLLPRIDHLIIGGAMAHTFLKAKGYSIGGSMYEESYMSMASNLLDQYPSSIILPKDGLGLCNENVVTVDMTNVPKDVTLYDVGPHSIASFQNIIASAKTIVWNGPFGKIEDPRFQSGTTSLIAMLSTSNATTIAGGGETNYTLSLVQDHSLTHITQGGGAFLEYLEGSELPGLSALGL